MKLSADHLSKRYGNRSILRDCSIAVNSGECVLVRGPSGGGKSTLLRMLALLETADSGTVSHGSQEFPASLKADHSAFPFLTVVFQQLFLWPNLTLAQNLSIVLHKDPNAAVGRSATEMLERFSISGLMDRFPHECSLGERQRLAISRALLSPARFLLLDEPSSALDKGNRTVLIRELANATSQDRGVLVITHDDHAFDEVAAHGYELEDGQLIRIDG